MFARMAVRCADIRILHFSLSIHHASNEYGQGKVLQLASLWASYKAPHRTPAHIARSTPNYEQRDRHRANRNCRKRYPGRQPFVVLLHLEAALCVWTLGKAAGVDWCILGFWRRFVLWVLLHHHFKVIFQTTGQCCELALFGNEAECVLEFQNNIWSGVQSLGDWNAAFKVSFGMIMGRVF